MSANIKETAEPTLDSVRSELRSGIKMMLLMATGHNIQRQPDRVAWIHDTVNNFLAFGVNSKLIGMDERADWIDVMTEKKPVAEVLGKWDEQFKAILAKREAQKANPK